MMKPMVLLGVAMAVSLLGAADTIVTETVNDLAPYTTADDSSYWTVSTHPLVTVRVTTDDTAFSTAAVLGGSVAAAIDTRTCGFDEGFMAILSTISPGMMLLLR